MKKKKNKSVKKAKSAASASKAGNGSDMKKKFGGVRELDISRMNVSAAAKE